MSIGYAALTGRPGDVAAYICCLWVVGWFFGLLAVLQKPRVPAGPDPDDD